MKFTFQEMEDDIIHGTPTTPGRVSGSSKDILNTNNSTTDYWNSGELWWDDGSYTGYRAGYAFQTYSWYSYKRREMQKQHFKIAMEVMNKERTSSTRPMMVDEKQEIVESSVKSLGPQNTGTDVEFKSSLPDSFKKSFEEPSTSDEYITQDAQNPSFDKDIDDSAETVAGENDENSFQEEEEIPRSVLFYVRALADYEAADDSEMDLYDGDLLEVFHQDPSGWWEGRRERDGKVGWFPSNYVYIKNEMWTIYEDDHELEEDENDEDVQLVREVSSEGASCILS